MAVIGSRTGGAVVWTPSLLSYQTSACVSILTYSFGHAQHQCVGPHLLWSIFFITMLDRPPLHESFSAMASLGHTKHYATIHESNWCLSKTTFSPLYELSRPCADRVFGSLEPFRNLCGCVERHRISELELYFISGRHLIVLAYPLRMSSMNIPSLPLLEIGYTNLVGRLT